MLKAIRYITYSSLLALGLFACTAKYLKYEKTEQLKSNEEFEQKVKIVEVPKVQPEAVEQTPLISDKNKKVAKSKSKAQKKADSKKSAAKSAEVVENKPLKHEPDLESDQGFIGRRPIKDPYRVGEEVTHKLYYDGRLMSLPAGTLSLKVGPFVEVNGRKSYQLITGVKSSSWFSSYYSVDDEAITLMDYELLIPRVFTLHVKESGQLRETRSFFDFDQLKAIFWEKKVTEKSGVEEKKLQWDILPYSQNVFSALFYLRTFQWQIGQEYSFRVSDEQENLIFKGKALAKEILKTDLGPLPAIKIKPEFTVEGVFKPVGDIFIWVSDDDRKTILRIETKIKIGSIISEVATINPGPADPAVLGVGTSESPAVKSGSTSTEAQAH